MRIQLGTVYMNSTGDFNDPLIGVVIKRMWWKPWRYSLTPLYYKPQIVSDSPGEVHYSDEGEPISNLTKLGAIGTAKLLGVEHRDFKE
jgi:hypothetical protein